MTTIGIDPGINGGIAVVDAAGQLRQSWRMPKTKAGKIDFAVVANILEAQKGLPAVKYGMEQMRPFMSKGKRGEPIIMNSVTPMLENSGRYKLTMELLGINYECLYPGTWQAAFRPPKGTRATQAQLAAIEGKAEARVKMDANESNKKWATAIVKGLWPRFPWKSGEPTDGQADAALIALYLQRNPIQAVI